MSGPPVVRCLTNRSTRSPLVRHAFCLRKSRAGLRGAGELNR